MTSKPVWRCRKCCGYRYFSESLTSDYWGLYDRLKIQRDRLEGIIGKSRPRYMRFATYDRLLDRLIEIEMLLDDCYDLEILALGPSRAATVLRSRMRLLKGRR